MPFVIKSKFERPPLPEGFQWEERGDYVAVRGDIFWKNLYDGSMSKVYVFDDGGYDINRLARDHRMIFYARKTNEKPKPRFPTDKPYPYGY